MKGNEGPKRQKLQTGAGPGAVKFFCTENWGNGPFVAKM